MKLLKSPTERSRGPVGDLETAVLCGPADRQSPAGVPTAMASLSEFEGSEISIFIKGVWYKTSSSASAAADSRCLNGMSDAL
jgi:hypothetical protein